MLIATSLIALSVIAELWHRFQSSVMFWHTLQWTVLLLPLTKFSLHKASNPGLTKRDQQ
jgi:hypothetical protein